MSEQKPPREWIKTEHFKETEFGPMKTGHTVVIRECAQCDALASQLEAANAEKQRHFEVALEAETRAQQRTKERDQALVEVERLRKQTTTSMSGFDSGFNFGQKTTIARPPKQDHDVGAQLIKTLAENKDLRSWCAKLEAALEMAQSNMFVTAPGVIRDCFESTLTDYRAWRDGE